MIAFSFNLNNPWGNNESFKHLLAKSWMYSKHKACELEICKDGTTLFEFNFSWSFRGQDHAGLRLAFGLFHYSVMFTQYDTRHWDEETNNWKVYDKENSNNIS